MRMLFWNLIAVLFGLLNVSAYADQPVKPHHQYGSFFTKKHVAIPPEHGIPLNEETVLHSCGIEHLPGTPDFFIKEPGVYRVIYGVSLKEKGGMVALELNDAVIPGSEMCVGCDNELSTMGLLINVCGRSCCDHKLRIVNNYPISELGWYRKDICLKSCCGEDKNVTAFLEIERVSDCCDSCKNDCCKK